MSLEPVESPSDKLSLRSKRQDKYQTAKKSIKFEFQKGQVDEETGEVQLMEPSVEKIHVAEDSYTLDRLEQREVGVFYLCKLCGKFPKVGSVNVECKHFFCQTCIVNFRSKIDTSKCPAVLHNGNLCEEKVGNLHNISGFVGDIHSSVRISCRNPNCDEFFKVEDLDNHESSCNKRGSYGGRQAKSLSKTTSKVLLNDSKKAIENISEWCKKSKVGMCDFLFYALKKNIHSEAPSLQENIDDCFKAFLHETNAKKSTEISPMMALALKLEVNLSHRQYIKISSSKLLGKLPGMVRVRKAGDLLDPGNVYYQVLTKHGDVISEHPAVPGSGLIDIDDSLGMMSFGDLNVNVRGFRASLTDTVSKVLEESFVDIEHELKKNEAAAADNDKELKAFFKVALDGTNAPMRSEKGSTRVSVCSWLRGTVCLVAVQVLYNIIRLI